MLQWKSKWGFSAIFIENQSISNKLHLKWSLPLLRLPPLSLSLSAIPQSTTTNSSAERKCWFGQHKTPISLLFMKRENFRGCWMELSRRNSTMRSCSTFNPGKEISLSPVSQFCIDQKRGDQHRTSSFPLSTEIRVYSMLSAHHHCLHTEEFIYTIQLFCTHTTTRINGYKPLFVQKEQKITFRWCLLHFLLHTMFVLV